MHVEITYPAVTHASRSRRLMLSVLRYPFIGAAIASLAVNLWVGGPLWSVIVIPALYVVWRLVLSPDLVEYNSLSQTIKAVVWASILLTLIDIFLVHGFAIFVIPIVCFGGLVVCMVFFFASLEAQKHNMLPLILFIFASILGSSIALYFRHAKGDWPYIVLLLLSVLFLLALIIVLGRDFTVEMKRRFHIK